MDLSLDWNRLVMGSYANNGPAHTLKPYSDYLTKKEESREVELMISPELNPVEQIWWIQRKMQRKDSSRASLWKQLETIWNSIRNETVKKFSVFYLSKNNSIALLLFDLFIFYTNF